MNFHSCNYWPSQGQILWWTYRPHMDRKCSSVSQPDTSLATHIGSALARPELWLSFDVKSWILIAIWNGKMYGNLHVDLPLISMMQCDLRDSSRWLNGRTRTATFTEAMPSRSLPLKVHCKLLRWCKDQIVSKIAVVHTSTHKTGSWLCSRKFACQISESPSSASYGKRFACACAVRLIANCETRMGEWVKAPRA